MTVVPSLSRTILNSMPDWQLFLLIVGLVLIAGLVGLFMTRRYLAPLRTAADAGVVAGLIAIVMTVFAFVLAFGVASLYEQFHDAGNSVSGEANDLAQIIRDSRAFPRSARDEVDEAVRGYILEVRNREFELMHEGEDDPTADALFGRIFTALQSYDPETESQIAFYGSAVSQLNDALSNRRARLAAINAALPSAFWTLIILTAVVSILTSLFVTANSRALEVLVVSCVSIIVGAGLLTALLLQYPFSGSVVVSSDPFVEGALRCVVLRLDCADETA